jgi:hypothetical protein
MRPCGAASSERRGVNPLTAAAVSFAADGVHMVDLDAVEGVSCCLLCHGDDDVVMTSRL